MFSLGAMTFLTPWILSALALVPVIWWLLRVMPPQPKTVKFPAYFLLKDIKTDIKTPVHTPWWLLLLRSLILIFFIIGLADPVFKMSQSLPGRGGSVLMVVDNGWTAAAEWRKRQDKIREFLPLAARDGRSISFLASAPSAVDGKIAVSNPMDASAAQEWIDRLTPQSWPADHRALATAIDKVLQDQKISYSVFFSDGTAADRAATRIMLEKLQSSAGGLTVVRDDKVNAPFVLERTDQKPGQLIFRVRKLSAESAARPMALSAYAEDGAVLDELKFTFPQNAIFTDVTWDILPELRNKVSRIAIQGQDMASAVYLTDSGWRQHPVGILAGPAQKDNESFLNEVYYLKRALEDNGTPDIGTLDELISHPLSALIWPDSAPLAPVERVSLQEWIEKGGFLIRFAGPALASNPEDLLLPVPLRFGQRAMEGSMTWEKPVHLGDIGTDSPLKGLAVPQDVTVTRQVLADPSPEVFEKTWLQLEDGTPLVTGVAIGKGGIVLVHTTAGPDWSNFCYSGLYVEMLKRMVSLSSGMGTYKGEALLAPRLVLDGFGRLQPPDSKSVIKPVATNEDFSPSPQTPPGIYGDAEQFQVFNLGDHAGLFQPLIDIPSGAKDESYAPSGEKNSKADLFKWAVLLLMLDMIVTFFLRGVLSLPARAAMVALMVLIFAPPAIAAEADPSDLSSNVHLAYMETGDQDTDTVSYNGLKGLANLLALRTTISVKGVEGVNPEVDDLFYYPFIYWPMTQNQQGLSVTAARNIQNYLGRGGMIVFDTRDGQFGDTSSATIGTQKMRQLTKDIQIPELMTVPDGHVLTRSFYLLSDFPGLYTGGKLWVEKEPSPNYDAVTSVIIGGNDWASAWSNVPSDRSRFILSGGEQQREMAYRVGINIVMMSLAGNYKSDQVHIPYILERLKR